MNRILFTMLVFFSFGVLNGVPQSNANTPDFNEEDFYHLPPNFDTTHPPSTNQPLKLNPNETAPDYPIPHNPIPTHSIPNNRIPSNPIPNNRIPG